MAVVEHVVLLKHVLDPTRVSPESRVHGLAEGTPFLAKILDDLASLRMTDLD